MFLTPVGGMAGRIMGRPATGHLSENRSKSTGRITSWGLRFSYAGRRQHLTLPASTREQAESERGVVMEEVRSGVWVPPRRRPPGCSSQGMPTFERFAGRWVVRQKDEGGRQQMGLSAAGQADLQWRMEHLLAYFAAMPLDEITVSEVDDFRLSKVREGTLDATSINKMLTTLAAILETAVEYELLVRGRTLRVVKRRSQTPTDAAPRSQTNTPSCSARH
jgi:hypothetical protein